MKRGSMTNPSDLRRAGAFLLLCAALHASPAGARDTDLQRCLQIADIAQRVACYDAIARAQQAGGENPAPPASGSAAVQTSTSAAPAASPRAEFGLSEARREEARAPEMRQLNEIETELVSIESVGAGYWQFATTDGAIWRLAEASRTFRPPRAGDSVRIRSGRLGSFYLEADRQPSMRIVRIK